MKILITAGPTIEKIDPVRYLTNHSTGRMGYELARQAHNGEHEVILVSGPTHLEPPQGVQFISIQSAQQMHDAVMDLKTEQNIFILSAAVADYTPVHYLNHKFTKTEHDHWTLELKRTPDILAQLGNIKKTNKSFVLAGFSLESQDHVNRAYKKLVKKNVDLMMANDIKNFGSKNFEGWIVGQKNECDHLKDMTKVEAAHIYLEKILQCAMGNFHATH